MLLLEKIKEIIYENNITNSYTIHETVYLLQVMGLNVSDYRFARLSNGLFSLGLYKHLQIKKSYNNSSIKKSVQRVLIDFKHYIDNIRGNYTFETFVHTLVLLHYIKTYCSSNSQVEQIFKNSISEELYNHVIAYVPEIDKFCYAISE